MQDLALIKRKSHHVEVIDCKIVILWLTSWRKWFKKLITWIEDTEDRKSVFLLILGNEPTTIQNSLCCNLYEMLGDW